MTATIVSLADRARADTDEARRAWTLLAARTESVPHADDLERLLALVRPTNQGEIDPFPLVEAHELAIPVDAVPWLVEELDLCPGAPLLLCGDGYTGKTLAAQSLALSVAMGWPVWDAFRVHNPGRVIHLDYEQGRRLTTERYQRLARGFGEDLRAAQGKLALSALPVTKLGGSDASSMLAKVADGAALVIVDSLRACSDPLDENSSEVRRVLDAATRASEATGACFVFIHHSRKSKEGGTKTVIRGSSAIFDASGSVLVVARDDKASPSSVSHEKARTSGITTDDFALAIEDVDGRAGLVVRRVELDDRADDDRHRRLVLEFVTREPGSSSKLIKERSGAPHHRVVALLAELEQDGSLRSGPREGKGGGRAWFRT